MPKDRRGLDTTAASNDNLAEYEAVEDAFLNYEMRTMNLLKSLLEKDPACPMALVMRGYLLSMLATLAVLPKIASVASELRRLIGGLNDRESKHVAALEALARNDTEGACNAWDDILAVYPLDLLALKMHHYTTFWMGRAEALRATINGVLHAWDEACPGYAYVLGMRAFAHEECGEFDRAEADGRRAVEANEHDLWAIHAVAHVLESQGRAREGIAWLRSPADRWATKNPFRGHLFWHRALFHLHADEPDRALALYDQEISDANTEFYLDIQNMVSLLQRLELVGIDVGERWEQLVAYARTHIDDHYLPLTDAHNFLALARAGTERQSCERFIESLAAYASEHDNYTARHAKVTTLPLCAALSDYAEGRYPACIEKMSALRHQLAPVGGSHAQRDLFELLYVDAAYRAKRFALMRSLLSQRIYQRPPSAVEEQLMAVASDALSENAARMV